MTIIEQSILEQSSVYCAKDCSLTICIWRMFELVRKRVRLQKKAAIIILDCDCYVSSLVLFSKHRWMTFPERVVYQKAIQMIKAMRGEAPDYLNTYFTFSSDVHTKLLRSTSAYQLYVSKPNLKIVIIIISIIRSIIIIIIIIIFIIIIIIIFIFIFIFIFIIIIIIIIYLFICFIYIYIYFLLFIFYYYYYQYFCCSHLSNLSYFLVPQCVYSCPLSICMSRMYMHLL